MAHNRQNPAIEGALVGIGTVLLGLYFAFHAIQGDFGLFSRVQIESEAETLRAEKAELQAELDTLSNKTRRLSRDYLDIDLLDERVRDVLGYARPDELVIQ